MDERDLITVGSFSSEFEARAAASRISARGIPTFVAGGEINTMMPQIGTALGGVLLQVPVRDESEAREALIEPDEEPSVTLCPQCRAGIDPGFHVCWSCGAALPPAVAGMSLDVISDRESAGGGCSSGGCSSGGCGGGAPALTAEQEEQLEEAFADNDQVVQRALRAALFSLLLPPFLPIAIVFALQSVLLPLSPRGNRRFLYAWGTILFSGVFWYLALFHRLTMYLW